MSRFGIARLSREVLHLRNLQRSHAKTPSFLSFFSTCASESAATPSENRYTSLPVGVALTEHAGRAVFASRKIGAGELIHTAKPIVTHPSLSLTHCVCYWCLKRLPKPDSTSEAAQTVSFCSEHCEERSKKFYAVEKKADWSRFNEYCRLQGLKYPLLVKRFACQVISGSVPYNIFDILQPETLSSDKISKMKEEFALLRSALEDLDIEELKRELKDSKIEHERMSFLTEEWYIGALARIRINAFRVELPGLYEDLLSSAAASVEAEAAVGNAVYMLPSFYNHDCDPNVNIVWSENVDAKMKALRDIEEGEELRICYIDASMDHEARQKLLYEGFGFQCNCSRCVSKD